ncbi:hypothetical protein ACF0H5_014345 [Mactra antiquata]
MMSPAFFIVLFGIFSLTGIAQAEICYDYYSGYFSCTYGCCGSFGYESCCASESVDVEIAVWVIVVSIIGGILCLSVVICLVVMFCCKSKKPGRIIHPIDQTQPAYITTSTYPVQYYGMNATAPPLQPIGQSSNSYPQPQVQPTMNQREGLQSEPPMSFGLPGNHRVV